MTSELPIEVDCQSVQAALKESGDFVLLDCREVDEHALVRIEGATLVPMSELESRVGELEPHRTCRVVVYCHHGGRSLRVARWLRAQGYQAQSMAGGIDHWAQEIDPSLPRY